MLHFHLRGFVNIQNLDSLVDYFTNKYHPQFKSYKEAEVAACRNSEEKTRLLFFKLEHYSLNSNEPKDIAAITAFLDVSDPNHLTIRTIRNIIAEKLHTNLVLKQEVNQILTPQYYREAVGGLYSQKSYTKVKSRGKELAEEIFRFLSSIQESVLNEAASLYLLKLKELSADDLRSTLGEMAKYVQENKETIEKNLSLQAFLTRLFDDKVVLFTSSNLEEFIVLKKAFALQMRYYQELYEFTCEDFYLLVNVIPFEADSLICQMIFEDKRLPTTVKDIAQAIELLNFFGCANPSPAVLFKDFFVKVNRSNYLQHLMDCLVEFHKKEILSLAFCANYPNFADYLMDCIFDYFKTELIDKDFLACLSNLHQRLTETGQSICIPAQKLNIGSAVDRLFIMFIEDPDQKRGLRNIKNEHLDLLFRLMPNLVSLELRECPHITMIPHTLPASVKNVSIEYCPQLENIDALATTQVENLTIAVTAVKNFPQGDWSSLKKCMLRQSFTSIEALANSNVEHLTLVNLPIHEIPEGEWNNLERLDLAALNLRSIQGIANSSIKFLSLYDVPELILLPPGNWPRLASLIRKEIQPVRSSIHLPKGCLIKQLAIYGSKIKSIDLENLPDGASVILELYDTPLNQERIQQLQSRNISVVWRSW